MTQTSRRPASVSDLIASSAKLACAALLALGLAARASGQDEQFNYDEAKVNSYTLPDPLVMQDGRPVTSAAMWRGQRRGEILQLFETQVYGRRPSEATGMRFRVTTGGTGRAAGAEVRVADPHRKWQGR